jgi:tRNA(fMet)-specific endonuclease VapC
MMYVLDTNVVLDYFRAKGNVAVKILAVPPGGIALPAIAAYEIWVGVFGSENVARRRAQFQHFLETIEVLPFDEKIARKAAEIHRHLATRGELIGPLDTLIAGTALAYDASLVTRNIREFARVPGLNVVNWYE